LKVIGLYRITFLVFLTFMYLIYSLHYAGYFHPETSLTSHVLPLLMNILVCFIVILLTTPIAVAAVRASINSPLDIQAITSECMRVINQLVILSLLIIFTLCILLEALKISLLHGYHLRIYIVFYIIAFFCMSFLLMLTQSLAMTLIVTSKIKLTKSISKAWSIYSKYPLRIMAAYGILAVFCMTTCIMPAIMVTFLPLSASWWLPIAALIFVVQSRFFLWPYALGGILFRDAYGLKGNLDAKKNALISPTTHHLKRAIVIALIALLTEVAFLNYSTKMPEAYLANLHLSAAASKDRELFKLIMGISTIEAVMNHLYEKSGTYNGIDTVKLFNNMPDPSSYLANTIAIRIINVTQQTYTITYYAIPYKYCMEMKNTLSVSAHYYENNVCSPNQPVDFTFTFMRELPSQT